MGNLPGARLLTGFFLAIFCLSVVAAAPNIVNVTECGVLSTPNMIYQLDHTLLSNTTNCLVMEGENSVFDGQNYAVMGASSNADTGLVILADNIHVHSIEFKGLKKGVEAKNVFAPLITDSKMSNLYSGIVFENVSEGVVRNVSFKSSIYPLSNTTAFIAKVNSRDITFTENGISNFGTGARFEYTSNSKFTDNKLYNAINALLVIGGDTFTIQDNQFKDNMNAARFESITDSLIQDNVVSYTANRAFFVHNSSNNEFRNNLFLNTNGSALRIESSDNNTITGTQISMSKDTAFHIQSSNVNTIINTSIYSPQDYGVWLEQGMFNTFDNLYITESEDRALYITSNERTLFTNVIINGSNDRGIYLFNSPKIKFDTVSIYNTADNAMHILQTAGVEIANLKVDTTETAIYIENSTGIRVTEANLTRARDDAIVVNVGSHDARFSRVMVSETNTSKRDIDITSPGIQNTELVDSILNKYNIVDSTPIIEQTLFGKVKFLEAINGEGDNVNNTFGFANNLFAFESDQSGLNRTAEVSLYNVPVGQQNYRVNRNGIICTDCTNLTITSTGIATFTVIGFGNYSVASDPILGGGGGGGRRRNNTNVTEPSNETLPIVNLNNPSNESVATGVVEGIPTDADDASGIGITGAVIGALRKPSFFIPLIFIIGLVAAVIAMRYRKAKSA